MFKILTKKINNKRSDRKASRDYKKRQFPKYLKHARKPIFHRLEEFPKHSRQLLTCTKFYANNQN